MRVDTRPDVVEITGDELGGQDCVCTRRGRGPHRQRALADGLGLGHGGGWQGRRGRDRKAGLAAFTCFRGAGSRWNVRYFGCGRRLAAMKWSLTARTGSERVRRAGRPAIQGEVLGARRQTTVARISNTHTSHIAARSPSVP
jgi:hypothetical protein